MPTTVRKIVIDTSFFEKQNFLKSSVLADLKSLAEKKWITIFITDIIYREILARFKKRIIVEAEKTRNIQNQLKELKVLKNSAIFTSYSSLPAVDVETVCNEFKESFDSYIKETRIKIITSGHLTIADIFDDYFQDKPPFSAGDKKSEFPDAFSIAATIEFFERRKWRCLFVTGDKDFDGIKNRTITPVKEVRTILDAVIREEGERESKTLNLIENGFESERKRLEKDAYALIYSYLESEVNERSELGEMEIDILEKIDLSDIEITNYSIVYLSNNEARLECNANFAYELLIAVEDKSNAWYDKEDDVYHFVDHKSIAIEDSQDVVLTVIVDIDDSLEFANMELEDVNEGKGFDVFSRWDDDY